MQFGIGGKAGNTWGGDPIRRVPPHLGHGSDGNGDGIADVYDPADAIPAAAGYLTAHGAPDDLRAALRAYNRADWYVDKVLATAADYSDGGIVVADPIGYAHPHCLATTAGHPHGAGPGAWGGHDNGRIPQDALCPMGGGHRLRCDAASAFLAMSAAHQAERGHPLPITDSYRDHAAQVDVHRRKPDLAARPGNSNHGWGLALDIDVGGWEGGVFRWLQRNAHSYGWHHPEWARIDGSKPEPWHWEFRATQ